VEGRGGGVRGVLTFLGGALDGSDDRLVSIIVKPVGLYMEGVLLIALLSLDVGGTAADDVFFDGVITNP
jgi:hypothetical protein